MNGGQRKQTAITFLASITRDVCKRAQSDKRMHEIVDALIFLGHIARESDVALWEEEREDEE